MEVRIFAVLSDMTWKLNSEYCQDHVGERGTECDGQERRNVRKRKRGKVTMMNGDDKQSLKG